MPFKDPAIRRAYLREWKSKNAEQHRWLRKLADAAAHANRRAAKYGVAGKITADDVRRVLATERCVYCGSNNKLGIDHVIPLHDGGLNQASNLVCCCHSCNASKWRQPRPHQWSREHESCVACGTTSRKHAGFGLCARCWQRLRRRAS